MNLCNIINVQYSVTQPSILYDLESQLGAIAHERCHSYNILNYLDGFSRLSETATRHVSKLDLAPSFLATSTENRNCSYC